MGARIQFWTLDALALALAKIDCVNDLLGLEDDKGSELFLAPFAIAQRHAACYLICTTGKLSALHSDSIQTLEIDGKGIDLFSDLNGLFNGMQVIQRLRKLPFAGGEDVDEGLYARAIVEAGKLLARPVVVDKIQKQRVEYAERIKEKPKRFRRLKVGMHSAP